MDEDYLENPIMNVDEENKSEEPEAENQNKANRKKTSDVWPHYTSVFVNTENIQTEYAQCNYCIK